MRERFFAGRRELMSDGGRRARQLGPPSRRRRAQAQHDLHAGHRRQKKKKREEGQPEPENKSQKEPRQELKRP